MNRSPLTSFAASIATVSCVCVGCSAPLRASVAEQTLVRSGEYTVVADIDVPPVDSINGCGSQALAAVIAFFDPASESKTVYQSFPNREKASASYVLLLLARKNGFRAKISAGTWEGIADSIESGLPSLVMFNRAPKVWLPFEVKKEPMAYHWSVVSGMSNDGKKILLAAPHNRHHVLERQVFEERWSVSANCLITILPAGELHSAVH